MIKTVYVVVLTSDDDGCKYQGILQVCEREIDAIVSRNIHNENDPSIEAHIERAEMVVPINPNK